MMKNTDTDGGDMPVLDMDGLKGLLAAMGGDGMLTVEIVPDGPSGKDGPEGGGDGG